MAKDTKSTPCRKRISIYRCVACIYTCLLCFAVACAPEHTTPAQTQQIAEIEEPKELALRLMKIPFETIESIVSDSSHERYELFLIKYAETNLPKRFLLGGLDESKLKIPVIFSFYLLRSKNRIILVDVGWTKTASKPKNIQVNRFEEPVSILERMGISPDEITDVVLTHMHWDHAGGIGQFNAAQVWLPHGYPTDELKTYKGSFPLKMALIKAQKNGRLHVAKPVQNILPGVTVVNQGYHLKYFQYVVVSIPEGRWILPSDIGALYENIEQTKTCAQSQNNEGTAQAIETLRRLVNQDLTRIIPSHDPLVLNRLTEVMPGILRINPNNSKSL